MNAQQRQETIKLAKAVKPFNRELSERLIYTTKISYYSSSLIEKAESLLLLISVDVETQED